MAETTQYEEQIVTAISHLTCFTVKKIKLLLYLIVSQLGSVKNELLIYELLPLTLPGVHLVRSIAIIKNA